MGLGRVITWHAAVGVDISERLFFDGREGERVDFIWQAEFF
jgi:hypothetical protein